MAIICCGDIVCPCERCRKVREQWHAEQSWERFKGRAELIRCEVETKREKGNGDEAAERV